MNETEAGEKFISGPSAVFYRGGAAHRNTIAAFGFEQIEIEFDPSWLGRESLPTVPVTQWIGGAAGAQARCLAQACDYASETGLRAAVQRFFRRARRQPQREPPSWIGAITRRLSEDTTLRIADLAREASRHPTWVGAAYRHATGERVQETTSVGTFASCAASVDRQQPSSNK